MDQWPYLFTVVKVDINIDDIRLADNEFIQDKKKYTFILAIDKFEGHLSVDGINNGFV